MSSYALIEGLAKREAARPASRFFPARPSGYGCCFLSKSRISVSSDSVGVGAAAGFS